MSSIATISPEWHRRILSMSLVISITITLFGFISLVTPQFAREQGIYTPLTSLVCAIVAVATAGVGLALHRQTFIAVASFATYVILLITAITGILDQGSIVSSYSALWVIVVAVGGAWGKLGIATGFGIGVAYGVYAYATGSAQSSHALLYVVTFLLPPVISALSLRSWKQTTANKDVVYHALAQQLSQVANKSEIVINAIGEGVFAIDSTGVIDLINPAAQNIMGWTKQDAIGLNYRSVFKICDNKGESIPDTEHPIQQVIDGDTPRARNDLLLETSSGKKINVWLQVSSVGQARSGAIVVFRDITNEISENRQRTEFISTASHEMRTPVAAIEGYLGLALNPATATIDDKARAFITKAHESAEHLGRLFQDLLDVSKADDGRLKNMPKPIEIVQFVREIASIMSQKAQEKGLLLVFAPDVAENTTAIVSPLFYIYADPDHVHEVVSNLIENAIKYTKQGSVTVAINATDNSVIISIHDTGIGIAHEDIPHLFQKFYRIDNSDTREIGGTGLGLYLCRRLVESMNGRIWVESTKGKGSVFNVELARLSTDEALARQAPSSSSISI